VRLNEHLQSGPVSLHSDQTCAGNCSAAGTARADHGAMSCPDYWVEFDPESPCSAHSRIGGVSPATNGTLRAAGINDTSSEERRVTMNMILLSPRPSAVDPQITSLTESS